MVVSNKEIKKVTLAYCVDNLTRKSDDAQLRNELNEMRMEETVRKVLRLSGRILMML